MSIEESFAGDRSGAAAPEVEPEPESAGALSPDAVACPAFGAASAAARPASLALSFGIEEEFFLVDPSTRDLMPAVPKDFLRECRLRFGNAVQDELQRPQLETATPVQHSTAGAREALFALREGVGRIARAANMRLVASGTHPLAAWEIQEHTSRPRYDRLIDDYQIVGRRSLLCGLHVHVGIPQGIDRVALMNRLMPWVPVFLALSTSSPFWSGHRTGLLSYRQSAYDEWPRSGVPDAFADEREYASFVDLLRRCGTLDDGSFLWWAIRPSSRYPTLELRIADACTHTEDALALASAFRCLVRAHLRLPRLGVVRTALARRVIDENRWRAKRFGTQAAFIDEQQRENAPFGASLRRMLDLLAPDAEALRCEREMAHLAAIPARGTSAQLQLAIYRRERVRGVPHQDALAKVVDWLAATTDAAPGAIAERKRLTLPAAQDAACVVNA
ncbi:MAG TPA: carboxylate-amine ligase [Xanthomonadaceae bacterium]|jgi:carboxylate-amine ligase